MYDFAYHRPKSLAEALAALKGKPEARPMSGGMTLIPTLKQRLAKPTDVVDLSGVKELAGIKVEGNNVTVGAMTRHADVAGSADVKSNIPALAGLAAHLMEASVADVVFENGTFKVAGTDKNVPLAQAVFAAYVPHNYPLAELEPGMDENAFYDPANFVYPAGTQICEVEIDPDTGVVEVVSHTAVDDFGNIINPMIVDGQVHGGIVQGVGQALLENAVYDKETGQLISGSYMDYTMPRADNVPSFKLANTVTPCPHNPLGVKGCGEAGAIASPAAVMNAVHNALAPIGVRHVEMPATSLNVWQSIQGAHRMAAE